MAEKKQFTVSEIENNKDDDKILLIIHDNVYNVKRFLNEHPGGEEVLLEQKSRNASDNFDDVGHSQDAMELMKKFQVGVIVESEKLNKPPKKGWITGYNSKKEQNAQKSGFLLYLVLGGVAVVLALLIFKF